MAAFRTISTPSACVPYGRSGYNKDGDNDEDEKRNMGRSGYNKDGGDDEEEKRNMGRSGYNKGDDEDEDDKKKSLVQ